MTGLSPSTLTPPAGGAFQGVARAVAMVGVAVLVALVLHALLGTVAGAGRYIAPHDYVADYLLASVWAVVLGATILAWPIPWQQRLLLLAAWGVRVLVMLTFMLYYEWNYPTLDAFGYYEASMPAVFDWSTVRYGGGTEILNAFAWLHARIVPASYHAMKLTCALIGLAGVTLFYRAAVAALGHEKPLVFLVLLFAPSVLFWSSILGKDPIILLGVALYAYGIVCWQRLGQPRYLVHVAVGLFIASAIRVWFLPILAAPLMLLALIGLRSALQRIIFSVVGAGFLWVAVERFRQQFALASVAELLSATNRWSQSWAMGGSAQELATEFTGIGSMIRFLPTGMFTALFRPLPGEVNNMFGLLAGAENLLLVSLAVVALLRTRLQELREPLVLWALAWIVAWSGMYGFVSYQNLGTAVRFKLQILPVLLLLLLYLVRRRPDPTSTGAAAA